MQYSEIDRAFQILLMAAAGSALLMFVLGWLTGRAKRNPKAAAIGLSVFLSVTVFALIAGTRSLAEKYGALVTQEAILFASVFGLSAILGLAWAVALRRRTPALWGMVGLTAIL